MPLVEWRVSCEWCGAKIGDPCVDLNGNPYQTRVHIPRSRLWDETEIHRLIENRPTLLPPRKRYAKSSSGIRTSTGSEP